jgi:hypothetical protein
MRLKNICTHEQANQFLQREYLPEHNRASRGRLGGIGRLSLQGAGRGRVAEDFSFGKQAHGQQ